MMPRTKSMSSWPLLVEAGLPFKSRGAKDGDDGTDCDALGTLLDLSIDFTAAVLDELTFDEDADTSAVTDPPLIISFPLFLARDLLMPSFEEEIRGSTSELRGISFMWMLPLVVVVVILPSVTEL